MLSAEDKKFIKTILRKELESVKEEGNTVIHPDIGLAIGEQKYEDALNDLIKKLE